MLFGTLFPRVASSSKITLALMKFDHHFKILWTGAPSVDTEL